MKSLFNSWKGRKRLDLEAELRAARPKAPEGLVRSIAASINPRPIRSRSRRSLGFVGALGVASLALLGATGGFSYAANGVANAIHATAKIAHSTPRPAAPSNLHPTSASSAASHSQAATCAQYGHAPTTTRVSPNFGAAGSNTVFTITGTNLGDPNVTVTAAGDTTTIKKETNTMVQFTLDQTTTGGSGPLVVTTCGGTASNLSFTVYATPNNITYTPHALEAGMTVSITGNGFTGVAKNGVRFGTKPSADATVVDDSHITVTVPSGLKSSGALSVTNKAGTGTAAATWTYTATSPTIKTVKGSPAVAAGSTNSASTITVSGAFFDPSDVVTVGGVAVTNLNVASATSMTFNAGASTPTGAQKVTITDSVGGSATSATSVTILRDPAPTGGSPTVFTPTDGSFGGKAGGTITITGSHLTGVTSVQFHGAAKASKPSRVTDGSFSVVVPKDATSGSISVINAAGTGSVSGFTLLTSKPSSIAGPSTTTRGSTINLTGTGFSGVSSVKVGSAVATFTVADDGHMTVTIPTDPKKVKNGLARITITNAVGSGTFSVTITG